IGHRKDLVEFMRNIYYSRAALSEPANDYKKLAHLFDRQRGSRFIENEHPRCAGDPLYDFHQLAFRKAEMIDARQWVDGNATFGKCGFGPPCHRRETYRAGKRAGWFTSQKDVFRDGELWKQAKFLMD